MGAGRAGDRPDRRGAAQDTAHRAHGNLPRRGGVGATTPIPPATAAAAGPAGDRGARSARRG